jgi:hypothetical protein
MTVWHDMESVPKDRRIIVATADNLYIAKWVQNIRNGEEAFYIGDIGDGDRLIIKKELVLKWTDAPKHPGKV